MRVAMVAALCSLVVGCAADPGPDVIEAPAHRTPDEVEQEWARRPYGDDSPCAVYGEPRQLDRVPVVYGLLGYNPGYLDARRRRFPNANTSYAGGCVTTPHSPQEKAVYYCPECREAERRWVERHPSKQPPSAEPLP